MQVTVTTFAGTLFLTYRLQNDFNGKPYNRTIPIPTTWCITHT